MVVIVIVVADLVAGEVVRERRVLELLRQEIREETRETIFLVSGHAPQELRMGGTHVVEASFLTTVRHLPVYAQPVREQREVSASVDEVGAHLPPSQGRQRDGK
jgi:hypothetical protein